MGLLHDKTALVTGVANRFSIAWSIAQALHREGARVILTYQGERVEESVRKLASTLPGSHCLPCDVQSDSQMDELMAAIDSQFGGLDILVHAIAYAPSHAIEGDFLSTQRDDFKITLEISAFSLTALVQRATPLMLKRGAGSVITLSYLGGERVVPHYNVMGVAKAALEMSMRYLAYDLGQTGIRVNAISAGPLNTASARAIKGYTAMIRHHAEFAPYKRSTKVDEVADAAVFLASDLGRGLTGEVMHIDAGFHIMGLA